MKKNLNVRLKKAYPKLSSGWAVAYWAVVNVGTAGMFLKYNNRARFFDVGNGVLVFERMGFFLSATTVMRFWHLTFLVLCILIFTPILYGL